MVHGIRIRDIKGRYGNKASLLEIPDQGTLRRLGRMERIDKGMLMKRIYRSEVDGVRRRGMPKRR